MFERFTNRLLNPKRLLSRTRRALNTIVPALNTDAGWRSSATFVALFTARAAPGPDFSREVLPLLEKYCVKCHGPEKQKGGLRFDTKEGAFKTGESGEKAIVPGHASQSRLIKLVSSKDDDERMPSKGEPLSVAQIDLLKRWIDAGAKSGRDRFHRRRGAFGNGCHR